MPRPSVPAVYPDRLDFVDRVLETCYNVRWLCVHALHTFWLLHTHSVQGA